MGKTIGIDLGTTNSCVAYLENGNPLVIPNLDGLNTTPSVVAFTSAGERVVGTPAVRQAVTNPFNTVYAVKRLIGQKFNSPRVSEARNRLPYRISEAENGDVVIDIESRSFSPQEISAMILYYLKACAESYLGEEVTEAVVTVPAHFNDAQRQATKDAALIAGLEVLRVINEPTAAGLAYGLNARQNGVVAVYDLGGGTFDITILEIRDGVFQVLSTIGETYLGGEDFDARLVAWLADGFKNETGIELVGDKFAMQRVKEAAEKAKKELSFISETEINLPFISSDRSSSRHLRRVVTRQILEVLTIDLVEKTIPLIETALADAKVSVYQVDEVILVGGQTHMPLVKRMVGEFFRKTPVENINPDEVVAVGAAVQSGILRDKTTSNLVLLLDVTPFSLGIETENDGYEVVIEKNTTIPIRKTKAFTTVEDNQRRVRIHVLQGDYPVASLNKSLAVFELVGIDPAMAGVPQVDVTFEINPDGLAHVSARDAATGLEQKIVVQPSSGLQPGRLEALIEDRKKSEFVKLDSDVKA